MSKMILIIEDERSIQNVIKAFLEDAGYTPAFDENPHLGGFLIGSDPEGNLFRVRESYPADSSAG